MEAPVIQVTPRFRVKTKPKKRWAKIRPGMSDDYLAKIRRLPSIISGRFSPNGKCEVHHLRVKEERGMAMKATDRWALPLTQDEHMAVHMVGSRLEAKWFYDRGVECYAAANALWKNQEDETVMLEILFKHMGRVI